jgi:hypothetical protein
MIVIQGTVVCDCCGFSIPVSLSVHDEDPRIQIINLPLDWHSDYNAGKLICVCDTCVKKDNLV